MPPGKTTKAARLRRQAELRERADRERHDDGPREALALWRAGRHAEARARIAVCLASDRRSLKILKDPAERFRTLVRLAHYEEACALAERFLDENPTVEQTRAFWNPWGWLPLELLDGDEIAGLERLAGEKRFAPMAAYLLANLRGGDAALDFLVGLPRDRYGWMAPWLTNRLLGASRWDDAERMGRRSLDFSPRDWWARFHFAEALICAGRDKEALEQAALGASEAPEWERASALSWKGELDLWLGRYADADRTLAEACRDGFPLAWCWRGAAATLQGRLDDGLALLDEALRRLPGDLELRVWRGENLRRRGRANEALRELALAPDGVWKAVNAGLAKAALGDEDGLRAEFARLPLGLVRFVERKLDGASPEMTRVLEEALTLARGFRREDYHQRVWLR